MFYNGETIEIFETTYDDHGKKIRSEFRLRKLLGNASKENSHLVSVYEAEKNQGELVSFGADGSITSRVTYAYDENGKKVRTEMYGPNGRLNFRSVYHYDKSGNNTEIISFRNDGSIYERSSRLFNPLNKKVETIGYKGDGSVEYRYVSIMDDAGRIIKGESYIGNTRDTTFENSYDRNGNLAENVLFDEKLSVREITKWLYEVDSVGNWTKKTTSKWVLKDGKMVPEPLIITERNITYNK